MNISITEASLSEIVAVLQGLLGTNIKTEVSDQINQLISERKRSSEIRRPEVVKEITEHLYAETKEEKTPQTPQDVKAESEETTREIVSDDVIENTDAFVPEQLHLGEVSFKREDAYKLATDLSHAGGRTQLKDILTLFNVTSLPSLKESDYTAFCLKVQEALEELNAETR